MSLRGVGIPIWCFVEMNETEDGTSESRKISL